MGNKIAAGFHACVDYELIWDTDTVNSIIKEFDLHDSDLKLEMEVESERDAWAFSLAHMKAGMGCEMVPDDPEVPRSFAAHFKYNITIGGTAARACISVSKIECKSSLLACCYNEHIKRLMPSGVNCLPSVGEDHKDIYPHVVLQYQKGTHICGNDIDFVTPRENRMMISRDMDSLYMPIEPALAQAFTDADVMLLSCYSEILDKDVLIDRLGKTKEVLAYLKPDCVVILEDGCYVKKDFRYLVHEELKDRLDVISMNEDELQEFIGKRIDVLDPKQVMDAIIYVYDHMPVKTMIVHSAVWALAYGEKAVEMEPSLTGGIAMSATRFRLGDDFNKADYDETLTLSPKEEGTVFCGKISALMEAKHLNDKHMSFVCLPTKDMDFVKHPTIVGLGDSFAGGLLPALVRK